MLQLNCRLAAKICDVTEMLRCSWVAFQYTSALILIKIVFVFCILYICIFVNLYLMMIQDAVELHFNAPQP